MNSKSKHTSGLQTWLKKLHTHRRWLISIGIAVVALISVFVFSFKANQSDASVDGYKLYKTTITNVRTNDTGDWLVKGKTDAPDDAKIIALTSGNYGSISSSITNITSWVKVKNGEFTTAVSAYNAVDKPYKNGRSVQVSIVAITGYSAEQDDLLTSGLKTAVLDFKGIKLTLDDALVKYCNELKDESKGSDDTSESNESSESSERSTKKDDTNSSFDKKTGQSNSKASREELEALNSAQDYLEMSSFSKQGLYDQLSSDAGEKFSASAAQYAVDHVKVNWNSQALKAAKYYQKEEHMSSAEILDQLTSSAGEGYTQDQAQYAVNNLSK